LKGLAMKGAAARLTDLQAEATALLKAFPAKEGQHRWPIHETAGEHGNEGARPATEAEADVNGSAEGIWDQDEEVLGR
jgi:hypothetical protein